MIAKRNNPNTRRRMPAVICGTSMPSMPADIPNPNITEIKCMTGTDAEAVEFLVPEGALITTAPLRDIGFPKDALVGGGIRDDKPFIATGDTLIMANDRIVIFALPSAMKKLSKFFE